MKVWVTKYAPAERISKEEIKKIYNSLSNFIELGTVIKSLPNTILILNNNRQIVYASEKLLADFNIKNIDDVLGLRPGELLLCRNSNKEEGGCGTSSACRMCGIVNSILTCIETGKTYQSTATVTDTYSTNYEYTVISHPFKTNNLDLNILTLTDNSSQKRKEAYEKIFFHDILNATGSLEGILNLMRSRIDTPKEKELIELAIELSTQVTEEIRSHRELVFAEEGMLKIKPSQIESLSFIMQQTKQIKNHAVAQEKHIEINKQTEDILFISDHILLKRVLNNMLKNALEASHKNETIEIGAKKENNKILFWVKNPKYIPQEEQDQIFQRSFSTKGKGRGLGTYSMKLIGEKYLNGKIYFTSNQTKGTIFYIELPTKLP